MGGDLLLQTPTQPTGVLTALESLARPETTALRIAAAYTTLGGATTLMPRLADRIGAARWAGMPKLVVTSRDYGLTEPKAVEYLRAEQGVEVRFSSTPPSFHPKLFAFDSTLGLDVLVGSANLTRAALTTNTEAVTVTSIRGDRAPFEAIWRQLLADGRVQLRRRPSDARRPAARVRGTPLGRPAADLARQQPDGADQPCRASTSTASATRGRRSSSEYRLGIRSPRTCGLF